MDIFSKLSLDKESFLSHLIHLSSSSIYVLDTVEKKYFFIKQGWITTLRANLPFEMNADDFLSNWISDKDQIKVRQFLNKNQSFQDDEIHEIHYQMCFENQTIVSVSDRTKVLKRSPDGEIILFLGILEDISKEQIALDLVESERLKAIESAKFASLGQMAAGIAHEINNPLAIIVGRAQQIKKEVELKNSSKEKIFELLQRIHETVERISKIIRGLRSFSRAAESDPMTFTTAKSLIDDTLAFCREKFYKHEVDLKVILKSDFEFLCRPVPLSQVLLNLLNNAFDAVQGQTENRWIELHFYTEDQKVKIIITDGGPGVPIDIQDKIMQPFFTTKEVGKGTGLGLSIASGIIKDHNGSLYLDKTNTHTTFIVEIPWMQD